MKHVAVFVGILVVMCLSQFNCLAAIIRVPADQTTIQEGIDAAEDGDTVLVADGNYSGGGNWHISFKGKAITVESVNGAESCVVICSKVHDDANFGFSSQVARPATLF